MATFLYCILLIPSFFARQIFESMDLDEKVTEYATIYVWITVPFTYFFYLAEVYLVYAQCQEVTWYTFAASLAGLSFFSIFACINY